MPVTSPVVWSCDEIADTAVEQEKWEQALERHKQLLGVDLHNCLAMYHMGFIWGKLEDTSQEVAWYERAVTCGYKQNDVLFFNMGMAYLDLRQMDKAMAAFNNAIKVNPGNADNHFGLALTANAVGNSRLAMRSLEKAVAMLPDFWDARIFLAKIYLDLGRMDAARTHLEMVLEQAPENEEAIDLWRLYKDRVNSAYER